MKYLLFILLLPVVIIGQNKIDPLPIITDTTENYDVIDPIQKEFFLGWNWGSPGRKLDEALNANFYHGYPKEDHESDNEYADSIRVIQNLKGNITSGRLTGAIFNTQSLYLEPTIRVVKPYGEEQFVPTLRNENGAIYGFQEKSNEISYINDPNHPDFGKAFFV